MAITSSFNIIPTKENNMVSWKLRLASLHLEVISRIDNHTSEAIHFTVYVDFHSTIPQFFFSNIIYQNFELNKLTDPLPDKIIRGETVGSISNAPQNVSKAYLPPPISSVTVALHKLQWDTLQSFCRPTPLGLPVPMFIGPHEGGRPPLPLLHERTLLQVLITTLLPYFFHIRAVLICTSSVQIHSLLGPVPVAYYVEHPRRGELKHSVLPILPHFAVPAMAHYNELVLHELPPAIEHQLCHPPVLRPRHRDALLPRTEPLVRAVNHDVLAELDLMIQTDAEADLPLLLRPLPHLHCATRPAATAAYQPTRDRDRRPPATGGIPPHYAWPPGEGKLESPKPVSGQQHIRGGAAEAGGGGHDLEGMEGPHRGDGVEDRQPTFRPCAPLSHLPQYLCRRCRCHRRWRRRWRHDHRAGPLLFRELWTASGGRTSAGTGPEEGRSINCDPPALHDQIACVSRCTAHVRTAWIGRVPRGARIASKKILGVILKYHVGHLFYSVCFRTRLFY